ncbi:hypothetical protein VTN49DRAFT_1701 [Thermomyces lanuginosus]|uniref:uncharacterized protein n=1 Tax=Thermomyces lanuginosus TaxID=5541 RepID=UPI00374342FA
MGVGGADLFLSSDHDEICKLIVIFWRTCSPNDEAESDRLDMLHKRCIWTIDFADPHPRHRSVKPGSWVEFQDWDGCPFSEDDSFNGTALQRYYDEVLGAFEKAGYGVRPGPNLEQWFKDAGFVNIHLGRKNIGAWNQTQAEANAFEGVALAARTRHKQYTKDEVVVLASQQNRKSHSMFDFYIIYGQRPEN